MLPADFGTASVQYSFLPESPISKVITHVMNDWGMILRRIRIFFSSPGSDRF
jgi:hypothetical protein